MVVITVELTSKASFVYNCMPTKLMGQYNAKWHISLIYVSKPVIPVISAIALCYTQFTSIRTLKCQWSEISYKLTWKSFQNDDGTLGCLVIQDFDLCKLDDLWHHIADTNWCKITKYGISMQILSLQGWNFAELMCCKNYTLCWWLWCHHSNLLVSRPLPSQNEKCPICCFRLKHTFLCLCCVMSIFAHTH